MIDPAYHVNIRPALEQLDLSQKQVRYAASLALNDTALSCMRGIKYMAQDGRFTLRRDRIIHGFRVKMSTKANLHAEVFHLDASMKKQEYPGTKTGRSGHRLGVPAKYLRPGGRDSASKSTNRIREADWPKNARSRKNVFSVDRRGRPIKIGGSEVMMVRLPGKAKATRRFGARLARALFGRKRADRTKSRGQILKREVRVMYVMPRRATMRARLGLFAFANENAPPTFRDRFPHRYAEALASAHVPYSAGG